MDKNPPVTSLLDWLACSKFNHMLGFGPVENMRHLCNLVDASNYDIKSSLGLEIHHATHKLPDLSLFGGHSLLRVPGICYPSFASDWEEFAENHCSAMDNSIIAEFDHVENGYKLMGFFQSYSGECQSLKCALDSIKFYASRRRKELIPQTGQELASARQALSMIECSIKAIGAPVYIGFIDRGMCAVKLITEVTNNNLPAVVDFCELHFHHIITRQLKGTRTLRVMLETLLSANVLVRVSVDVDLSTASHLDRLSFECMTGQDSSKEAQSVDEWLDDSNSQFLFHRYFPHYSTSLRIQNGLPYGEKRPSSINLIDSEVVSIRHSHRKLLLGVTCAEVKDYLLASIDKLNSERAPAF
jgi:hypothetical protein